MTVAELESAALHALDQVEQQLKEAARIAGLAAEQNALAAARIATLEGELEQVWFEKLQLALQVEKLERERKVIGAYGWLSPAGLA